MRWCVCDDRRPDATCSAGGLHGALQWEGPERLARAPGGGGVFSPYVEAKFTPEERAAKQKEWNADRDLHWRVDTAKGEIVSDGKGVHLATEKPMATSSSASTGC